MKFGLFDSGEKGEHNSVGSVKMSSIFLMQDDFFLWSNAILQIIAILS